MLWAIDQQQVSSALGVLSICSWLTAQSPQLYENYRLGECLIPLIQVIIGFIRKQKTGDVLSLLILWGWGRREGTSLYDSMLIMFLFALQEVLKD